MAKFPCEVNGNHEVSGIKKLDPTDFDENAQMSVGYKWIGVCIHCHLEIVAKDKEEYSNGA